MKNALTNLHKQMSNEKSLINNIRDNLGRIGDQLSKHFPDAVTRANALGQNFQLKKLKSRLMQENRGRISTFDKIQVITSTTSYSAILDEKNLMREFWFMVLRFQ